MPLHPRIVRTFGPVTYDAADQLADCLNLDPESSGVLCADHHVGYSMPIGGVLATKTIVIPAGVGYDIGCGNMAVRTNVRAADVDVSKVMDEIVRVISFGVGRSNMDVIQDAPVFDLIAKSPVKEQRELLTIARAQLGTVGSGNHYVDLFADDLTGLLWVGVHFGSRGFGHKTATGFLSIAAGGKFDEPAPKSSGIGVLSLALPSGQDYIDAMEIAGEYAYAGRQHVVQRVLDILGARAEDVVHNHHNFAWQERHNGESVLVTRKGATPAFPGQRGFIGGSMGENAVIIHGIDSDISRAALYSTVHGAGRAMARGAAKRAIVWEDVLADLKSKNIELRGAAADEAPAAYKRLPEVLAYHADTIEIEHVLRPIGVAMAGSKTFDPYRD